MATRIKDGEIPYTWWTGIEITANHVINVLLRDENNLIQVNDDSELYVDLQLVDWIEPDDDFPVWVTTGKILEEDWWPQSWIILNWKTTSGDYNRWIYANDEKLYFDPWTWEWLHILTESEIMELLEQIEAQIVNNWKLTIMENWVIKWEFYANQAWDTLVQLQWGSGTGSNTQTFFFTDPLSLPQAQAAYDWYKAGNEPILNYDDWWGSNNAYFLAAIDSDTNTYYFQSTRDFIRNRPNKWYSELVSARIIMTVDPLNDTVLTVTKDEAVILDWVVTRRQYNQPFMPEKDSDPVSKKYVDDLISWVTYTAWDGINIDQNNVISNTWVLTINNNNPDADWNIDVNEVPSWWTEWQVLKKTENWYEWGTDNDTTYTAGHWINIDQNNEISNTLWFEPQPWGSEWQVLKLWPNWTYGWQNESWWGWGWGNTYYGWTGISIDGHNYINNTKPFNPSNSGSAWQVLKKTQNGYQWSNESWGESYTAGSWINITSNNVIENTKQFNPAAGWSTWQVLTKTANGYEWANVAIPSGENNVKFWNIDSDNMTSAVEAEIMVWVTASPNNWAILNDESTNRRDVYIYDHTTTVWQSTSCIFFWVNRNTEKHTDNAWYDYTVWYQRRLTIATNGSTYSTIVDENPDPLTHTNYLSVTTTSGYSAANAFIPTEDYQPTTKKYVDSVVTWWWIPYTAWNWISIINNVISNTWVLSGDSWVTYTIKVSNSDPAAWTPNNVITLVL